MAELSAWRWAAWGCVALPTLGCYRYVPTTVEAVVVGSEAHFGISTQAQRTLKAQLGLATGTLDGTVLEKEDVRLLLSVGLTDPLDTRPTGILYQRIEVPTREVTSVSLRRLSVAKTGGLVGALMGSALFVGLRLLKGGEPGRVPPVREKGLEGMQGVNRSP